WSNVLRIAPRPCCCWLQLRPPVMAPSTTRSWPLMKLDSSLARNTAACAMSSGRPARGIGCAVLKTSRITAGGWVGRAGGRRLGRQPQRLAENAGRNRAGRDRVDADTVFAKLHCHAFCEVDHRGLGCAVDDRGGEAGKAACDTAIVDDAAAALFAHIGRGVLH